MKIAPFPAVACVLLHDTPKPPDMKRVLQAIRQMGVQLGLGEFSGLFPESDETDFTALLSAGKHDHVHVKVMHSPQRLEMEAFQDALDLSFNRIMVPEAEEAIRRHASFTFINVARGVLPNIPELHELLSELNDPALTAVQYFTTLEQANRAKTLCRELAGLVLEQHPSTLVYWALHEKLVRPDKFIECKNDQAGQLVLDMMPQFVSSAS